jgi:hypothetical protein
MNEPTSNDAEPLAQISIKLLDNDNKIEIDYKGSPEDLLHMLHIVLNYDAENHNSELFNILEKARLRFLNYKNRKNN